MPIVILILLLSVIPGIIAYKKEQNFFVWWFLGLILWPVAMVMVLMMGPASRCFWCDTAMRKEALVCPSCGKTRITDAEIDALAAEPLDAPDPEEATP